MDALFQVSVASFVDWREFVGSADLIEQQSDWAAMRRITHSLALPHSVLVPKIIGSRRQM